MFDSHKTLAMIKAIKRGQNPKQPWILEQCRTAPTTAKDRSILGCIERCLAGKSNPTDDEMIRLIKRYA